MNFFINLINIHTMSFIKDKNDNYILDTNGNKIEFNLEYIYSDLIHKHKEPLHINDNNNIDTENREIRIKDATDDQNAVSLRQLQNAITSVINNIKNQIAIDTKTLETKILTQMLNFRNEKIKNRIQRKYITIPKTPYQFIKLFDINDVGDGIIDLNNVIILNVWIKRFDRYHNAKSSLVESGFNNSLEFFFNATMTEYHTYFSTAPSNWDMSCFIEWLRIPQTISIDNESIDNKPKHE